MHIDKLHTLYATIQLKNGQYSIPSCVLEPWLESSSAGPVTWTKIV